MLAWKHEAVIGIKDNIKFLVDDRTNLLESCLQDGDPRVAQAE